MKKPIIKTIVITMIAIMTISAMNIVVCSAASKKTYKLPEIIERDRHKETIKYKNGAVKFTVTGGYDDFVEKYTYKGKGKYKKCVKDKECGIVTRATITSKAGRIVMEKGKQSNSNKYTNNYYYKNGKLYKCVSITTYTHDKYIKTWKTVYKIRNDKHGNIIKVVSNSTITSPKGEVEKTATKVVFNNTYKGNKLKYFTYDSYVIQPGGKWTHISSPKYNETIISYGEKKLTKKQYKKYKSIVDYRIRSTVINY